MSDPKLEELISAYLDGELTADEQSHAERLLDSDQAARVLAEELRALSCAFQALPQQTLGEDLSEAVLARALATQRNGTPAAGSALVGGPANRPTRNSQSCDVSHDRSPKSWRRIAWVAMSIAACLMIALFSVNWDRSELRHTALLPADGAARVEEFEVDEAADLSASIEAIVADRPAKGAPGSGVESARRAAPVDEFFAEEAGESAAKKAVAPQRQPNLVAGPKGDAAKPRPAAGNAGKLVDDRRAVAGRRVTSDSMSLQEDLIDPLGGNKAAVPLAQLVQKTADEEGAIFVQVNITAEAARAGAFVDLLARSSIDWRDTASLGDVGAFGWSFEKRKSQSQAEPETAPVHGPKTLKDEERASEEEEEEEIEVVLVEASPEQLAQTLEQITARSREFDGYQITSSKSPAVEHLAESYEFVQQAVPQSFRASPRDRIERVTSNDAPTATAPGASSKSEPPVTMLKRSARIQKLDGEKPAEDSAAEKESHTASRSGKQSQVVAGAAPEPSAYGTAQVELRQLRGRAQQYYIERKDWKVGQDRSAPGGELNGDSQGAQQRYAESSARERESLRENRSLAKQRIAPKTADRDASDASGNSDIALGAVAGKQSTAPVEMNRNVSPRQTRAYFVLNVIPSVETVPAPSESAPEVEPEAAIEAEKPSQ